MGQVSQNVHNTPLIPILSQTLSLSLKLDLSSRACGRGGARPRLRPRRPARAELARARPRRPGRSSPRVPVAAGADLLASPPRALHQIHGEDRLQQPQARRLLALAAAIGDEAASLHAGALDVAVGLVPLLQLPAISFFLDAAARKAHLHLAQARG